MDKVRMKDSVGTNNPNIKIVIDKSLGNERRLRKVRNRLEGLLSQMRGPSPSSQSKNNKVTNPSKGLLDVMTRNNSEIQEEIEKLEDLAVEFSLIINGIEESNDEDFESSEQGL